MKELKEIEDLLTECYYEYDGLSQLNFKDASKKIHLLMLTKQREMLDEVYDNADESVFTYIRSIRHELSQQIEELKKE